MTSMMKNNEAIDFNFGKLSNKDLCEQNINDFSLDFKKDEDKDEENTSAIFQAEDMVYRQEGLIELQYSEKEDENSICQLDITSMDKFRESLSFEEAEKQATKWA